MKYTLIAILSFFASSVFAQKNDRKLEQKIKQLTADFKGDIGVYLQHTKRNTSVSIQSDTLFPTASIIKVPLLVGVFSAIEKGNITLNQTLRYDSKRIYGGSGLMQFYKDSAQTDVSTLIGLMLSYSDNVASIWLQELAGGGETINPLLAKLGFENTRVNSKTKGREDIWKKYGWGQTTPREMATLFMLIRNGTVFSPQYSEKMYRYLKNQYYNGRSLSQIPADINVISKSGSVDDARGEVVLVNAPSGDYVFCILTKNNKDQSWKDDNEAEVLTRKISNLLWNYFEPKRPYTPYPPIK